MAIHRCLFWAEDEKLKVYYYSEQNKNFDIMKKQGEQVIKLDDDIWNWWKEEASFNSQKDEADFCFIYDIDYEFIQKFNFKSTKNSIWTINILRNFFEQYSEHSNIRLINEEKHNDFQKQNKLFADNSIKIFYTNIKLCSANVKSYLKKEDKADIKNELSDLAEFFINKMNNENS